MSQEAPNDFKVDPSIPESECPGGLCIGECQLAALLLKKAKTYKPDKHLTATNEMRRTNHLHYSQTKCPVCSYIGSVILDMDGRRTVGIQLSFINEKNTTDEV